MREVLAAKLKELVPAIKEAERVVMEVSVVLINVKCALQAREDALILDRVEGVKIDGKNAEIRSAQLREHTANEREMVRETEIELDEAKRALSYLRTEYQATLALVELFKGVA